GVALAEAARAADAELAEAARCLRGPAPGGDGRERERRDGGEAHGAPTLPHRTDRTIARVIDLRSDTATRPTAGMRAAIAAADVGDEQKREDPTVNELERRAAELLGQEEAVYLPTATMANQIALRILGEP